MSTVSGTVSTAATPAARELPHTIRACSGVGYGPHRRGGPSHHSALEEHHMHTVMALVLCIGFPVAVVAPFVPLGFKYAREAESK